MTLRDANIAQLGSEIYDVLIVGGGINGAVSAAALAAKGVKVGLIERHDFASGTSSQSSNLVWGGIKYLESYEFLLVNKLCKSRNHLMASYPSTVKEIRFLTTIAEGFRFPAFIVYWSTLLYWAIGRFVTRRPNYRSVKQLKQLEPVINTDHAEGGFEYSDCYLYDNDARFVFNFIRSAMDSGCAAANYVESLGASREEGIWHSRVKDTLSGDVFTVRSTVLINACGPWVDKHNQQIGQQTEYRHVFSKGVHLIVERITDANRVLAFFASDGRLFFVIPMGPKTCIGTTDTLVHSPETEVSDADRDFVLDNANRLLNLPRPLSRADIIAERCGVRPLAQKNGEGDTDWVSLSRKHKIEVNTEERHLSIFGGKLTDCLNVGNDVVEQIEHLGVQVPLPDTVWYGEPDAGKQQAFLQQAHAMELDAMTDPSSSEPLSKRLWRRYGCSATDVLKRIRENPEQAKLLIENAEYLRAEVELAAEREMITQLDDFLRRRSKISQVVDYETLIKAPGLKEACRILFGDQAEERLAEYFTKSNENRS